MAGSWTRSGPATRCDLRWYGARATTKSHGSRWRTERAPSGERLIQPPSWIALPAAAQGGASLLVRRLGKEFDLYRLCQEQGGPVSQSHHLGMQGIDR